MAYNRNNYLHRLHYIISVYNAYKNEDIPDSRIVKNYFPLHQINITYRQWMNIKGTPLQKVKLTKIEPIKTHK